MIRTVRDRARGAYADAIARQGPAWINAAASVRAGFENVWIKPGLDALEAALRGCVGEDEEAGEVGPTQAPNDPARRRAALSGRA